MQQMRLLRDRGYRPVVACRPETRVMEMARHHGLQAFPVRFRNSVHLPSIVALRRWMHHHQPRLAICHSGHDSNNLAIAARLMRPRRPYLLRSRTYQPGKASSWTYNHMVDATMLPSRYLQGCLLRNSSISHARLHVVYPGIDFAALDSAAKLPLPPALERWLANGSGPLMAHVAMLRGEKGHRTVLEALSALKAKWPGLRYLIAGDGPHGQVIEATIRQLGLEDRVLLAGVVEPVAPLLARADFVVMPSSVEPLGMAQIEALGLGLPVIASNVGGIPETVRDGETGLLVPADDVAAWVAAIDRVLSDPAGMVRLAQAGRSDVRSRFSAERNLAEILRLGGLSASVGGHIGGSSWQGTEV